MKTLIFLLAILCVGVGCNSGSSTQTNYGDNAHFIITTGNDNSNIGNKTTTPAPVVITPVVVAP